MVFDVFGMRGRARCRSDMRRRDLLFDRRELLIDLRKLAREFGFQFVEPSPKIGDRGACRRLHGRRLFIVDAGFQSTDVFSHLPQRSEHFVALGRLLRLIARTPFQKVKGQMAGGIRRPPPRPIRTAQTRARDVRREKDPLTLSWTLFSARPKERVVRLDLDFQRIGVRPRRRARRHQFLRGA